jgi:hypothetical protein
MIVEITTIHYGYDEIYKKYGIDKIRSDNPVDEDYPTYEKYIQFITTAEHSERLITIQG